MKLLLVQKTVYYPTFGGANKSNRLLLEELTARGHSCRVVAPSGGAQLSRDSATAAANADRASHYQQNGAEVCAVANPSRLREQIIEQARSFNPDWILVSSEDPGQHLLDAALSVQPDRVYIWPTQRLLCLLAQARPFKAPAPRTYCDAPQASWPSAITCVITSGNGVGLTLYHYRWRSMVQALSRISAVSTQAELR